MTTLAILFAAIVLLGALLVLCAVAKGALTRNPWLKNRTQADFDRERFLAGKTLRRIHP